MVSLNSLLSRLSEDHRGRLEWFRNRTGQEIGWPGKLPGGRHLCTLAKGIYKPKEWDYALSVRQSIEPNYPDLDPVFKEDGSWSYQYHQEHDRMEDFDKSYGNLSLMRCSKDLVPIAVFRKTVEKPARYRVLGLALVESYKDGYFQLAGFAERGANASESIIKTEDSHKYETHSEAPNLKRDFAVMGNKEALRTWIIEALEHYGGTARMVLVSKWIWENHREELENRGDLFYRWQYELRWAATSLRHNGIILPAEHSERGIWVLSSTQ